MDETANATPGIMTTNPAISRIPAVPAIRSSNRIAPSGRPLGLGRLLAQQVVERRLGLALGLRDRLVEAVGLEIAGGLEHLLEGLSGGSPQPDPERGEHRRVTVREAVGDLDLGQGLLGLRQELLVVHAASVPRRRRTVKGLSAAGRANRG